MILKNHTNIQVICELSICTITAVTWQTRSAANTNQIFMAQMHKYDCSNIIVSKNSSAMYITPSTLMPISQYKHTIAIACVMFVNENKAGVLSLGKI